MGASRWFRIVPVLGLVAAGLLAAGDRAIAQNPIQEEIENALAGRGAAIPNVPPQGAWGEIINVTDRWLVLQNHAGQQFPIAVDDIEEFLVRWPSNIEEISPQALVEAVGPSPGSNIIRVDHVDFFEGGDRLLVAPTYRELLPNNMAVTVLDPGFNRFMNPWDYGGQNMLYGWAYPVPPGMATSPTRLHVVGSLLNRVPLRLSVLGNNQATVVPSQPGGFTVTQITMGEPRMVSKGDFAYLMPIEARIRGLRVAQLVVYKNVMLRAIVPEVR